MMDPSKNIDLGNGIYMRYCGWYPDRDIPANAERYANIPDIEKCCITIYDDSGCQGIVTLDVPGVREVFGPNQPLWNVVQWEPLTLTPSILNPATGFHGFITNGKWVPA